MINELEHTTYNCRILSLVVAQQVQLFIVCVFYNSLKMSASASYSLNVSTALAITDLRGLYGRTSQESY